MDRLVDLDAVAVELAQRRSEWIRRGLAVGDLTWRDAAEPWPQQIVTDRTAVADPESLGLVFRAGDNVAMVVLWRGGWSDVDALVDGRIVAEAPDFSDVTTCVAVVEALAARLLNLDP